MLSVKQAGFEYGSSHDIHENHLHIMCTVHMMMCDVKYISKVL